VKRTTLTASLVCSLLIFSMLGCGGLTNHLQSITLTVPNGTALSGGVYNLVGAGSTMQLKAVGNYSDSKTKDLTNKVTWNVMVDPAHGLDYLGNPLLPPCKAPSCPSPSTPPYTNGTVEYSVTGLITAVEPANCSWVQQGTGWFFQGDYVVTATFGGVTSQPIYIPIASSSGPGTNGECGPTAGG